MTKKLYYEDPYLNTFEAVVISCSSKENYFEAVLNQTAFYPLGGGQPADKGTLNGIKVMDVSIKEGIVYHKLEKPLVKGEKVKGIIDSDKRMEWMQHHTGEHIISGLINKMYGYENVGFHMGEDCTTCDFNGELTKEQIAEIEKLANDAIYKNLPVKVVIASKEEVSHIQYRSKLDLMGEIRLVEIEGYDCCACCGMHVLRTGEIGIVKCIDSERHRGGTRIFLRCGKRALLDYVEKHNLIMEIGRYFSCQKEHIMMNLEKKDKLLYKKEEELRLLKDKLMTIKVEEAISLETPFIYIEEEEIGLMRELTLRLIARTDKTVIIVHSAPKDIKYVIGSRIKDVRVVNEALIKEFDGKGGGSSELCQGSIKGSFTEVRMFLEALLNS